MKLLSLPSEVLCDAILPHLQVRDLQALDTAISAKLHRMTLRKLWKSYEYLSLHDVLLVKDIQWLVNSGVNMVGISTDYNFLVLALIVTRMPKLKQLKFYGFHRSDLNDFLQQLGVSCPHLEVLSVARVGCSDVTLQSLAQSCQNLHTLHIQSNNVTDAGIQIMCNTCSNIRNIDLSFCKNLSDASLMSIADRYPNLQSIAIKETAFTDNALRYLAARCHQLQTVALNYKYWSDCAL